MTIIRVLTIWTALSSAVAFTAFRDIRHSTPVLSQIKSPRHIAGHFLSTTSDVSTTSSVSSGPTESGSSGVELAKDYLNSPDAAAFVTKLVLLDQKLTDEAEKLNFWTGDNDISSSYTRSGHFST